MPPADPYASAVDLADAIRNGRTKSEDALETLLARIDAAQPTLNAYITVCADEARAAARAADAAVAQGDKLSPLHGVPVSIKDIINTAGVRTTFGSKLMESNVPPADAVAVKRLKAAGAIVIGKTTTPDFANKLLTDAPLFGTTRNPWNLDLTPGGSSGGSAAAVAAGLGPLSLATDAGASTRLPAACTGIVGFKPTLGLVPHNQVPDGFANFIHLGIMARTVRDTARMLDVLSGPDASDPWSLATTPTRSEAGLAQAARLDGLRLAWRPLLGNTLLSAPVRAACEAALGVFADLGAAVTPVDAAFENAEPTWRVLQQSNWAVRFAKDAETAPHLMDPALLAGVREGQTYTGATVQNALYKRTLLFRAVQAWFDTSDFVLTPTISRLPLRADHDALDPIEIDGQPAGDMRQSWCSTLNLFNLTGHPAVSIPCGWTDDGLPVGIQIVGRWLADTDVLRVAAAFESAQPWADRRPPFAPD
ncbi:MAG: amidase [Rhodospirillales bacterium]